MFLANPVYLLYPIPDFRNYPEYQKQIKAMSKMLGLKEGKMKLPTTVDLRGWCSPVKNQGSIGSCTAHAGDYPKSRTKPHELQPSGLEYLE